MRETAPDTRSGLSPIDRQVGACIRARRKLAGLSQEKLAAQLGITFQQIQKYETGTNRVTASRLYDIAQVLRTPLVSLFDGLPDVQECEDVARAQALARSFAMSPDGMELAELYPRIGSPRLRQRILELIREIAEGAADERDQG